MCGRAAVLCALAILAGVIPCAGQTSTPPAPAPAPAQLSASPEQARLLKSTEAFVRELFGWAPDVKVTLGPLGPSAAADFYIVPIVVKFGDQSQSGEVYVSKDGKALLRGEIYDMAVDPFAANRAKIHVEGNPSKGPANARVTVVEYADFQCPHCRELSEAMKAIETQYPQVRVVYKDFPLTQIHPWAETAAVGARCAFTQSPEAFWKVHDSIFENQDVLSAENAWDKLVEFATQAGLNADAFKACLASPDAQKAVAASRAEGEALGISSTPTVYVNGRPLVGGDPATLVQYLDFEIAASKK
ncbi:MAG: DsbA family protein [Acidobacteriia bacterium]|nr:DsbA family protein [Terriglobia bacterium]